MIEEERKEVAEQVKTILSDEKHSFMEMNMYVLPDADRKSLVEKHLISEDLAKGAVGQCAYISKDESISVMVNEEDHIRIQAMTPGFALDDAYQAAEKLAIELEESLPIAFSEKYGFLTACPTNTGTGLRASVMVHLPALTISGKIKQVMESLNKAGYTVRGRYGENSQAFGNLYQISNQMTLGLTEKNILASLSRIVEEINTLERKMRETLYTSAKEKVEDRVYRSLGELTYARLMGEKEALNRISDLRLGAAIGFMNEVNGKQLMQLSSNVGDASVQKMNHDTLQGTKLDERRAAFIREILTKTNEKE